MTEKLYYLDPYIREFTANVLYCERCDKGFLTVLDRTAFFPEEGGQSADTGYIGAAKVWDVYEKNRTVYHITDREPGFGSVECKLDFDERFEKMQLHSAEHILCGIIHRLYGLENVGFHIGKDVVTFDISAPLTRRELDEVETLANEAVFSNIKIETFFPDEEELSKMEYRSKLDISEDVRIVKIGDIDSCACCAPHVNRTGEIGIVKILDFEKHRGGLRIYMVAGRRALFDYRTKYENIQKISALLSTPQHQTAEELLRYMNDSEQMKLENKNLRIKAAEKLADSYPDECGNSVVVLNGFSSEEMRAFANAYKSRVSGYLVTLCGEDASFRYIIMKNKSDLSSDIKEINKALSGRGGGRGEMVSGTFSSTLQEINNYFK